MKRMFGYGMATGNLLAKLLDAAGFFFFAITLGTIFFYGCRLYWQRAHETSSTGDDHFWPLCYGGLWLIFKLAKWVPRGTRWALRQIYPEEKSSKRHALN